uniref:ORF C n=1 Tax=Strongyloides stercoralis TaxID=6248 RepID=A0A0K0DV77_STRER
MFKFKKNNFIKHFFKKDLAIIRSKYLLIKILKNYNSNFKFLKRDILQTNIYIFLCFFLNINYSIKL